MDPDPIHLAFPVFFALTFAVATTAFLLAADRRPGLDRVPGGLALGLARLGRLLDGRRWALGLEPTRLALALPVLTLLPVPPGVRVAGVARALPSGAWLLRVRAGSRGARAPLPAP
jgi:hypothetical protein